MADKPSKGLVLYGDGIARFVEESSSPNNSLLHSFASLASCGLLSLPHSPPSESEDGRIVREFFAELLDECEAYTKFVAEKDGFVPTTITEKFMGVKAAIVSSNLSLKSLGSKLGFTVLQSNELIDGNNTSSLAESLLNILGFQQGKILGSSQFDLVFVHIGSQEKGGIENLNTLVGEIMQKAQPGSEIASRLHTSVVLSYGAVKEDDDHMLSFLNSNHNNNNSSGYDLSLLFPRQSYTVKGGKPRENVRHYSPMLVAQWQSGVTRKDMVEKFSFKDFRDVGVNLVIPADRFLHEIAFKLWKAPKYGA